jgi:hypothetical protein
MLETRRKLLNAALSGNMVRILQHPMHCNFVSCVSQQVAPPNVQLVSIFPFKDQWESPRSPFD